jgi:hypothetical protein
VILKDENLQPLKRAVLPGFGHSMDADLNVRPEGNHGERVSRNGPELEGAMMV